MTRLPSTPQDVLRLAMDREQQGHQFYLQAAAKTADAKGKHMFEWLAGEETKHYQKLEEELKAMAKTGTWRPAHERSGDPHSKPVTKGDFPVHPEVAGEVRADAGELDALHIGMAAEKEAVELYSHAAETATEASVREMFLKLAQEEQGHFDLLESEHELLAKSGTYFTLHRFSMTGPR